MTVSERFTALLESLRLTPAQAEDGETKHRGVRRCLNGHYYSSLSESANSMLVGSWGKRTRVRPPRDIDVLFELPKEVYARFEQRPGNKQSQLLQEVKGVLQKTYTATDIGGDGQVVVVPFVSYAVEVVPAFRLTSGQYWICDTNAGGRYKMADPKGEVEKVQTSDQQTGGNARRLIKMLKRWQEYCAVPLKSFCLELLAIDFLGTWPHASKSSIYYDWMIRDFLEFLLGRVFVIVPGTHEIIWLGDAWKGRAARALANAKEACQNEEQGYPCLAGSEWQKIFGSFIPTC